MLATRLQCSWNEQHEDKFEASFVDDVQRGLRLKSESIVERTRRRRGDACARHALSRTIQLCLSPEKHLLRKP